MPSSFGYRARTRKLFQQPFRKHGTIGLSKYLTTFKVGDYVDVKANAAVHRGMPHKFYHGRTGVVWNVTARAVGVAINKRVGNRIIKKKIHVRVEHVNKSRCREDFLRRVQQNDILRRQAKADPKKKVASGKRQPKQPKEGHMVHTKKVNGLPVTETLTALKYQESF